MMQYKIKTANPEIYGEGVLILYTYPESCSDHPEDWTATVFPVTAGFSLLEEVMAMHKRDEEYYNKMDKIIQ